MTISSTSANVPPPEQARHWSAVAEWYHAYFTGLVMTMARSYGLAALPAGATLLWRRGGRWLLAAGVNIPRRADVQAGPVGRDQRSVDRVPGAVGRLRCLGHVILLGVPDQCLGQSPPLRGAESVPREE